MRRRTDKQLASKLKQSCSLRKTGLLLVFDVFKPIDGLKIVSHSISRPM